MLRADEFQQIAPDVFYWSVYASDMKADLSSSALIHEGRLYFFDPVRLSQQAMRELEQIARPAGVFLTSETHGRAAAYYQQKFSIPVHAHHLTVAELAGEVKVDIPFQGGESLFDFLEVIHLPGTKPGESAFYASIAGGVCVIGDALINFPGYEFSFLPDKYSDDPALSRESLGKLRGWKISVMLFAHGQPLVYGVNQKLSVLLREKDV